MQLAEQTAESAMSGVGRVVEETQQACSVAEAAIAEAATVSSHMESNMAHATAQTEATTAQAISALTERV